MTLAVRDVAITLFVMRLEPKSASGNILSGLSLPIGRRRGTRKLQFCS